MDHLLFAVPPDAEGDRCHQGRGEYRHKRDDQQQSEQNVAALTLSRMPSPWRLEAHESIPDPTITILASVEYSAADRCSPCPESQPTLERCGRPYNDGPRFRLHPRRRRLCPGREILFWVLLDGWQNQRTSTELEALAAVGA